MPERRISVITFRPADRTVYYCQWRDPASGRKKTRSTGTPIKRDAERFRAKLEDALNVGAEIAVRRTTWKEFRSRVERDFLPEKRATSRDTYLCAIRSIEKEINPNLVTGVDAEAINRFKAKLRDRGLAESTIASQLRQLKAMLRWGHRHKLIPAVPHIEIPKLETVARGRAITEAEFDRLLVAVPAIVGEARAASWRHLLQGLYLSGLRISEAVRLTWDDPQGVRVDLDRAYPVLFIPGRFQKGRRDTVTPLTPDFAAFLAETPVEQRVGYVFNPIPAYTKRCQRLGRQMVDLTICRIGRESGVVVKREPVEHVSAHDLRRSFCFRWAQLVLPQVLRTLARHRDFTTTLNYYVEADATMTAEAVWTAVKAVPANRTANTTALAMKTAPGEAA